MRDEITRLDAADRAMVAAFADQVVLGAHGSRRRYRHGCRCLLCRAAEAAYRAQYRAAAVRGLVPLGRREPAGRTWLQVHQLRVEGFSRADLARRLGLRRATLVPHDGRVTVRVRRLVDAAWHRHCGMA